MKVYVLITVYGHNDSDIVAIYATPKLAEADAETYKLKYPYDDFIVEEYEVEGCVKQNVSN